MWALNEMLDKELFINFWKKLHNVNNQFIKTYFNNLFNPNNKVNTNNIDNIIMENIINCLNSEFLEINNFKKIEEFSFFNNFFLNENSTLTFYDKIKYNYIKNYKIKYENNDIDIVEVIEMYKYQYKAIETKIFKNKINEFDLKNFNFDDIVKKLKTYYSSDNSNENNEDNDSSTKAIKTLSDFLKNENDNLDDNQKIYTLFKEIFNEIIKPEENSKKTYSVWKSFTQNNNEQNINPKINVLFKNLGDEILKIVLTKNTEFSILEYAIKYQIKIYTVNTINLEIIISIYDNIKELNPSEKKIKEFLIKFILKMIENSSFQTLDFFKKSMEVAKSITNNDIFKESFKQFEDGKKKLFKKAIEEKINVDVSYNIIYKGYIIKDNSDNKKSETVTHTETDKKESTSNPKKDLNKITKDNIFKYKNKIFIGALLLISILLNIKLYIEKNNFYIKNEDYKIKLKNQFIEDSLLKQKNQLLKDTITILKKDTITILKKDTIFKDSIPKNKLKNSK